MSCAFSPSIPLRGRPPFVHCVSPHHKVSHGSPAKRPRPVANLRRSPSPSSPRPGNPTPNAIPQTIEYAIRQCHNATAAALMRGETHIKIELPMGRSRAHWYRMSPLSSWYTESSTLAFHYAELFTSLHITLVLGHGPGVSHPVPWITNVIYLDDVASDSFAREGRRVVIFGAISENQRDKLDEAIGHVGDPDAVVLFNCGLNSLLGDVEVVGKIPFRSAYICRAFEKCAVLKEQVTSPWSIFVEIAVFEYEWVGDIGGNLQKEGEDTWLPSQSVIESFALMNGARQKGVNGYFETNFAGCEGGFWPFMTACCRDVLPMDGRIFNREAKEKSKKNRTGSSRPFGFF